MEITGDDGAAEVMLCVTQRTFAWKRTRPLCPGSSVPPISQRNTCEPASLSCVVNTASRSVCAEPGTYSSRPDRLSTIATSVIGRPPTLLYRSVNVTTSPGFALLLSAHLTSTSGLSG